MRKKAVILMGIVVLAVMALFAANRLKRFMKYASLSDENKAIVEGLNDNDTIIYNNEEIDTIVHLLEY